MFKYLFYKMSWRSVNKWLDARDIKKMNKREKKALRKQEKRERTKQLFFGSKWDVPPIFYKIMIPLLLILWAMFFGLVMICK